MFGSSENIIYVDRHTIRVGQVSGNQVKHEKLIAQDWQFNKLLEIFQEIKKNYGSSAYVVLGDDLSYVLYEKIKLKKDETLQQVLTQIVTERVPEEITSLNWHHWVLEKQEAEVVVQITAFVTEVYSQLMTALEEAKIKVIQVEPIGLALASLVENTEEPMLVVYQGYRKLALVTHQATVIGIETLNTADPKKEIKELIFFVKEKYNLTIKDVKQKDLHPMLGVVKMKDKSATVKKINSKKDVGSENQVKISKKHGSNLIKMSLIPILLLILLALLSFRGWLPEKLNILSPERKTVEKATLEEAIEEIAVEEVSVPTPTPIDLSQYSVQILNGSGVAGVAGEVEEILTAEGFASFELGNAANYDYVDTIVQIKEGLAEQVFSNIDRALNSDYDIKLSDELLTDDSDYDVIVTVGINKEE